MPRIGFFCDDCGLLWASKRKNEIDGGVYCDDCAEDHEDESENSHPLSGSSTANYGHFGSYP